MSDILLRLNDIIHLQPMGGSAAERYPVRLIGVAEGRSLIVVSAESRCFVLGEQYVARCLSGMSVYGFTTDVLKVAIDPYAYLHLSYPQKVQSVGVRQSERVRVSIPVEIQSASGETHAGILTDLSHTGAQVAVNSGLGKVGEKATLAFDLAFAGVTNKIVSEVVVKSVRENTGKPDAGEKQWLHGVHFEGHSEQQHLMLHGFVYEQMAARRSVA